MAWSNKRILLLVLLLVFLVNSVLLTAFWLLRQRLAPVPARTADAPGQVAYEPFAYEISQAVPGANGGQGFGGAWEPGGFNARKSDVFSLQPGGLSFSNLAVTGKNHLRIEAPAEGDPTIGGVGRLLGADLAVPGTVHYLSFLFRPDGEGGYGSVVLGTGVGRELSIGRSSSGSEYHVSQRGGTGRVFSNVIVVPGETVLLVVKMEFAEGPDRFTLFVNPAPGQPEPGSDVVKHDLDLATATHLFLYSRSAWSVDEIRLGQTWSSVTPAR